MIYSLKHQRPIGTPQSKFVYDTPSLNPKPKKRKTRKSKKQDMLYNKVNNNFNIYLFFN